jgi:segregation and condensation protein A
MAYDVHLEIFEGPLDLLLYLIKKNDLDISEIPIAQITAEYLSYLDMMKDLNLDIAGEFLLMASTLMQIKAHMLLPSPETDEEEENPLDELKAKLLEYQKYKEVAQVLLQKEAEFSQVHYRSVPPVFDKEDFVLEVSLFELLDSFRGVLKKLPGDVKEIVFKEIPIEEKIREILDLLETRQYLHFSEIFERETTKHGLIVSFMALLELIRLKQVIARQSNLFEDVRIYRVNDKGEVAVIEEDAAAVPAGTGTSPAPVPEPTPVPASAPEPAQVNAPEPGQGSAPAIVPATASETVPAPEQMPTASPAPEAEAAQEQTAAPETGADITSPGGNDTATGNKEGTN